MPKRTPKYCLHEASGHARVYINRQAVWLGPYGSRESKRRYRAVIDQWREEQNARTATLHPEISVGQLIEIFFSQHVATHYRKNGKPTTEVYGFTAALAFLDPFADLIASDFTPLKLKAVRKAMIAAGLTRGVINQYAGRVKRMFKWAVSEELVCVSVFTALESVSGLQRGRCNARESDPVLPVPLTYIDAVQMLVSRPVSALVDLQLASGCRPGEALSMRTIDLNLSGEIWEYRPVDHKTEHRGRQRIVYLGPKAQNVIRPFLKTDLKAELFSPTGRACKYRVDSYRRCISRACRRAGVPVWSPNQLRHNAATEIRRQYGLEAAQVILGHSQADVTQVYAERDMKLAKQVAKRLG